MRIDSGSIQDLYHYSLAMQGNSDSGFASHTLVSRLEAGQRVYEMLTTLNESEDGTLWESVIKESCRFVSEAELNEYGVRLQALVCQVAGRLNIDPHSGEKTPEFILGQVKAELGRNYKSAIRQAWMTGDYAGQGLDQWASQLQSIRNYYGPSWLVTVRV